MQAYAWVQDFHKESHGTYEVQVPKFLRRKTNACNVNCFIAEELLISFWDMTPFSLVEVYRRFRETYRQTSGEKYQCSEWVFVLRPLSEF
jgi:hypothetical protein